MNEHIEPRKTTAAVYIIFLRGNNEVLLIRRRNTGYQDGMYQVPAGHIELKELPTDAAIREAKEEVGVDIVKKSLKFGSVSCRPMHDITGNRVDFFFVCKQWVGKIKNMEPEKYDDMMWAKWYRMPPIITPHVLHGIVNSMECSARKHFREFTLDEMRSEPLYGLK